MHGRFRHVSRSCRGRRPHSASPLGARLSPRRPTKPPSFWPHSCEAPYQRAGRVHTRADMQSERSSPARALPSNQLLRSPGSTFASREFCAALRSTSDAPTVENSTIDPPTIVVRGGTSNVRPRMACLPALSIEQKCSAAFDKDWKGECDLRVREYRLLIISPAWDADRGLTSVLICDHGD